VTVNLGAEWWRVQVPRRAQLPAVSVFVVHLIVFVVFVDPITAPGTLQPQLLL
jgi:hypothetical protein